MTPQERKVIELALEALGGMQNAIYNIGGEHVIDLNYAVEKADVAEQTITAIKEALEQPAQEPKCNPHPKAPHGFNRNASHANDRYTCECEGWDAYDAGYQAGVLAGIEASTGQEPEQEPVAWLYEFWDDHFDAATGGVWRKNVTFLPLDLSNRRNVQPLYTTPPQPKEPEQEPVAVVTGVYGGRFIVEPTNSAMVLPVNMALYTHPQPCKPLTRGQIREIEVDVSLNPSFDYITPAEQLCRAIEAAHGIKE